ncbi:MAG: hypothetical protein WBD05_07430 [Phycisphaerae bacterium]
MFKPRTIVLASLLAAGVIATVGSLGDVCLGDECPHIRQVRAYAKTGTRVPADPLFSKHRVNIMPFNGTPLWHAGLAVLWRLTGTQAQVLSQFYHMGFYLLLLLSVYYGTRLIWGTAAASWAWLLTATMPMVCAYSIMLYQDVPGIAVSALAMLLLWRKNFFWSGVCLAAAYLTKMNMLTFAPWAVLFAAWWAGGTWKRRLVCAALVAVPVALAFGYDTAWRFATYGDMTGYMVNPDVPKPVLSAGAAKALQSKPANYVNWKPFPVHDPVTLVSHLGVGVLVGVCAAMARAWDSVSKWLWVCFAIAVAGFLAVFVRLGGTQIRYLFPAVLVLLLLCGKGLAGWRLPMWLKAAIVAGCVLQAAGATVYVYQKRQISEWDAQAYAWVAENTDPDTRIMFPERVITNEVGRKDIWGQLNPAYFMAEANDAVREEILRAFGVTHIAVPLRRIYDRREEGDHAGGYARDFVQSLDTKSYLMRAFSNEGFLVFAVVPPEVRSQVAPGGGAACPVRHPGGDGRTRDR